MAKIIAICNQKGGVGKTTTAVNLSACLAALEKRVLLVDMDPQANASQGLGFFETQEEDVVEALLMAESPIEDTTHLKAIIQKTEIPYLHVLTASPGLAGMEIELVNAPDREQRLSRVLNSVKDEYDYIFIDSPPSLGLLTINVLSAANSVMIPIQCEFYALHGLAELLNTIRIVQKAFNPGLEVEGALMTMFDARLSLSRQVVDQVKSDFAGNVFKTVIPRNIKLGESPSHGKPVILYDVQCLGSQKYMELAKEVLEVRNG